MRIIAIGKPSHEYRELLTEYEKRIRNLEVIEYKESVKDEQILRTLHGHIVVLDIQGTLISSEEFCPLLADVTFLIGGPNGLSPDLKKRANKTISLGRITLPHQLARLVLTEQLYRAQTIIQGKKYHK